ncbi:MAG: hypothetical protein P4M15_00430, partial [Alphaproteobacteria bacterium]|nr:hypothetical protein [Alphaproteobacteria bacterium]
SRAWEGCCRPPSLHSSPGVKHLTVPGRAPAGDSLMPNFSPTDAAFVGFRFVKERPGAVAAWAGAFFVCNVLSEWIALLFGGDALRNFQQNAGNLDDLRAVFSLFLPAAPVVFTVLLISLIFFSVIIASGLRSFLGIDSHVRFYFAKDELRIALLIVLFWALYFFLLVVIFMGLGIISNISDVFSPFIGGFFVWVTPMALFAAVVFVNIRLSLVPIIAVDRKRIDPRESWVSTRGHFWPLAGALVLSLILLIVMGFLAFMIVAAVNDILTASTHGIVPKDLLLVKQADESSLLALVLGQVLASLSWGALLPVILGPLVRAYQAYDAPDAPPAPVPPVHA